MTEDVARPLLSSRCSCRLPRRKLSQPCQEALELHANHRTTIDRNFVLPYKLRMKVLVSGATGLIGQKLCRRLDREGHQVTILSRSLEKGKRLGFHTFAWQPEVSAPDSAALEGVDVVVHLAGEHIAAGRWTSEHKRRIRDSRVLSTRNMIAAMRAATVPPKAFICASAIGFYGDRGEEKLTEQAAPGTGFLAEVCQEWEAAAAAAREMGVRVAQARIGVVLAAPNDGGALPQMLPAFKFGLGASLGNGTQWFPWIHVEDVVGIFHHAIFNEAISTPINTVAPNAVTNAEFTETLAETLHRPAFFAAPSFVLRLGLGEMADLLLSSVRVIPAVALTTGYEFKYPILEAALQHLLTERVTDTHP